MENTEMQIKSWEYIIQTKKEHIDFINKIIEAYDGLGNVRTLDNQNIDLEIKKLHIIQKEVILIDTIFLH